MFMLRKPSEMPSGSSNENEEREPALKSSSSLEVHWSDVRMWQEFLREFNLEHIDLNKKEIIVYGLENNVAITRAFRLENSEHFTALTESEAEADMLKSKGNIRAVKGEAEWHKFDKQGFIVVAMNGDIHVTKHLLKNVQLGGWFLCGIHVANALRGTGYKLMGLIDRSHGHPSVDRSISDEIWEDVAVTNESEYDSAEKIEGMVTKDEMRKKLKAAGRKPGKDVVADYIELLDDAKDQHNPLSSDGNVIFKTEQDGVEIEVKLNTVLPVKENEHQNKTFVMKREI
ncbi:hypothetical protein A3A39_00140 [Candidatus Kaiserbacteria bacterium RIFCSPLOWO2_01_FULL_54_13]|uniref:Uncharacterized protein n=1 Tax=Candidatus Kaiserbacteria bacterium RIFCSPLOWO2_01_FULL_54_13 TaxID=1798512 RepID=A0A1F6F4B7_9BACT|nr:MAG: hypothetical protein A3A39_00140 [Candidatus Kaiserbacteria bacterium RIFCSPLOWO2_01_FULL_54_13]